MKKNIFYLAAISVIALSSCKKEYQCDCETTMEQQSYDENGNPMGAPSTTNSTSSTTIEAKKDDAESKCKANGGTIEQSSQSNGFYVEQEIITVCELR